MSNEYRATFHGDIPDDRVSDHQWEREGAQLLVELRESLREQRYAAGEVYEPIDGLMSVDVRIADAWITVTLVPRFKDNPWVLEIMDTNRPGCIGRLLGRRELDRSNEVHAVAATARELIERYQLSCVKWDPALTKPESFDQWQRSYDGSAIWDELGENGAKIISVSAPICQENSHFTDVEVNHSSKAIVICDAHGISNAIEHRRRSLAEAVNEGHAFVYKHGDPGELRLRLYINQEPDKLLGQYSRTEDQLLRVPSGELVLIQQPNALNVDAEHSIDQLPKVATIQLDPGEYFIHTFYCDTEDALPVAKIRSVGWMRYGVVAVGEQLLGLAMLGGLFGTLGLLLYALSDWRRAMEILKWAGPIWIAVVTLALLILTSKIGRRLAEIETQKNRLPQHRIVLRRVSS